MEVRFNGKCPNCKRFLSVLTSDGAKDTENGYPVYTVSVSGARRKLTVHNGKLLLPTVCACKNQAMLGMVQGEQTDHKCGDKCFASQSRICKCACGGKNHGKAHEM